MKDFVSHQFSSTDGLPSNSVTDILQVKDGYLYFGFYDGLCRFDGEEFYVQNKHTDRKLDFVSARVVFEDDKENIWIGTNDEGVVCITRDGSIMKISTISGLPNNSVRAIEQDKDGFIWVGTYSGLACIDRDFRVCKPKGYDTFQKYFGIRVSRLYCDLKGRLWIICGNGDGVYFYDQSKFIKFNGLDSVKEGNITFINQDESGNYWFAIPPYYVVKKDEEKEVLYTVSEKSEGVMEYTDILHDTKGNVWIASTSGITILSGTETIFLNQKNGLIDEKINRVYEDSEGNIWIATDCGGLQQLTKTKFKTTSTNTTINAIVYDEKKNGAWIAGDDGLYFFRNGKSEVNDITEKCRGVRVRHLDITKDNSLLVSTYGKLGQLKFSPDGSVKKWNMDSGLKSDRVRVALESSDGDLYIGTTGGLFRISESTGEMEDVSESLGFTNSYIMCIFEDSNKNIWCGTDGGGVFIIGKDSIRTITSNEGLAGNVIFKISEINGEVWVCTGNGVSRFTNNIIYNYTSENGFVNGGVFQIIPDSFNRLWCTSNKGVCYVTMAEMDKILYREIDKLTLKYFGSGDGLISQGVTSTSLSDRDDFGRIWFPLVDGFSIYDPVIFNGKVSKPKTHIQSVVMETYESKTNLNLNEKYILIPSGNCRLTIKYTGISFVSPEKTMFKYKLEGFDKDFSDWTTERKVSYTNLKNGNYKFYLIAKNADDVEGVLENPLQIVKVAAFYETIWFYTFLAIFIILLILLLISIRLNGFRRYQQKLENLVQSRTRELLDLKNSLEHQVADRTKELLREKQKAQVMAVEGYKALANTIDAKDKYTKNHSTRVAEYSKMIAKKMGKPESEIQTIYYSALLHDIGKIGIPNNIINKPSKLTDEEYETIKTHSALGGDILKTITSLPDASVVARFHHERYDGRGYPDGISGLHIPEVARIVCIADSYDAMTSNRSYRKYLPQEVARAEIEKNLGTQFDPEIGKIMLSIIDDDVLFKMHE